MTKVSCYDDFHDFLVVQIIRIFSADILKPRRNADLLFWVWICIIKKKT